MDKMYFLGDLGVVISEEKWDKIRETYSETERFPVVVFNVCSCPSGASHFVEKSTLRLWKIKPKDCRSGALFYALNEKGDSFWSNGMLKDSCLYSDDFIPVVFSGKSI